MLHYSALKSGTKHNQISHQERAAKQGGTEPHALPSFVKNSKLLFLIFLFSYKNEKYPLLIFLVSGLFVIHKAKLKSALHFQKDIHITVMRWFCALPSLPLK